MTPLPSLIAFGPLTPGPAQDQLRVLRQQFQQNASLFEPLAAAIHNLVSLWDRLMDQDAALEALAGRNAAEQLAALIASQAEEPSPNAKGNIMTMPITIISQIVQYLNFLEYSDGASHSAVLERVADEGGIQGFCAGLLSAMAVASAKTKEEVLILAATSVSLAFCVGAYIDLDQARDGGKSQDTTLALRWKEPVTIEEVQRILGHHPTYVAATRDVRDITVTTSTSAVMGLQQDLSQHGVTSIDTGLGGRYHRRTHHEALAKIVEACEGRLSPQFGQQGLVRSNTDARVMSSNEAVQTVLESILVNHSNWYQTISDSISAVSRVSGVPGAPFILSIGADAIPYSIAKSVPVVKLRTLLSKAEFDALPFPSKPSSNGLLKDVYPKDAVAVIGMACKFPGADSIDEFWDLLTEGRSMLEQMPKQRFDRDNLTRSPRGLQFWGNFVRDIDAFDHKFFKKSAREAASMDPQQRLLLQVAYQALESSGYFADPSKPRDIGCYLGSCSTDYDGNVGSHPPTAYSTTGTLRAFLSGRISHYFGWSGPSLVFDTACSSSAVAIHTACTALRGGECSQALAGGVTLMTTPYLYENLATAHFLSPSGATKPFDTAADGYCRGEGVGLVVLKKLSDALANGDNVLGVIASSAVNQNANCVSITVPHSVSQGTLYRRVAAQAGVKPDQVTFVEAHGTGTPVGGPIEMESIRQVFGGPTRDAPLFVSSVKGNIGHLEGASGVAALIKALLQIQHRTVCVQASFNSLNPKIPPLEADKMCIPTWNRAVPTRDRPVMACINNYGAAGSNAAMMLIEAPQKPTGQKQIVEQHPSQSRPLSRFPIQIAAASTASLIDYCRLLSDFCQRSSSSLNDTQQMRLLRDVAFGLAKQQNQELPHKLTMAASTDMTHFSQELKQKLGASDSIKQRPKELPVILCFGGQVGQHVGLSKRLWEHTPLFRFHLDHCDEVLRSMGHPGLYPAIFQTAPITDVAVLQPAIFSTQYACARAWVDSGLRVDSLIGHSLGQFAVLCVSGILSLRDGLKLVAGRASLIKDHWGTEPGTMIAVEAERSTIEQLTNLVTAADPNHSFETACFNSSTSHVIVSDKASADRLEAELVARSLRHRRLNVTHGFHSRFTEPLMPRLKDLASSLALNEAKIPIETCTDGSSWLEPSADLIAAHTRDPVFFGQAAQRIQDRFGPCTFLEAGSDSSVISMVRRALGQSAATSNSHFIPMELNKETSLETLADTTVKLWDSGHQVQFWNFHRLQGHEYNTLRLPPYQFEKARHWLKYEEAASSLAPLQNETSAQSQPPPPPVLIRLRNSDSQGHHFDVDWRSDEYQALVGGHVILGKPESPPALYVELVARAIEATGQGREDRLVSARDLLVETPLDLKPDRKIELQLQRFGDMWRFQVTSMQPATDLVCHATGIACLVEPNSAIRNGFARYQRLIGRDLFAAVENDADGTSIKGPMVYKVLSQTVEYADFYRNVKSVSSSGNHVVGKVAAPKNDLSCFKGSIVSPHILDSFLQIGGLYANHMHESTDGDYALSSIEQIQYGPQYRIDSGNTTADTAWGVFCLVSLEDEGLASDIFVYDAQSGLLVLLLLGVRYSDVQKTSFRAAQTSAAVSGHDVATLEMKSETVDFVLPIQSHQPTDRAASIPPVHRQHTAKPPRRSKSPKAAIFDDVCTVLEKIAEVEKKDVKGNATLEDLGVDSLMMIEVIGEISSLYKVELPIEDLEQLTDFDSLVQYLHGRGCKGTGADQDIGDDSGYSSPPTGAATNSTADASPIPTPPETPSASRVAEKLSDLVTGRLQSDNMDSFSTNGEIRQDDKASHSGAQEVFDNLRFDFDKYAEKTGFSDFWILVEKTGFSDFWKNVYPDQAKLVEAYIVDAFRALGCDLASVTVSQPIPPVHALPRHNRLMGQLHKILMDGGLLELQADGTHVRTTKPIDPTPSTALHERMLKQYPQHVSETMLLHVTGSCLADCLTGKTEPLSILFANRANRAIMADVYEKAPMCQATTQLLADFLARSLAASQSESIFQILEVGAGTGGTAKYLVDFLDRQGVKFEYTFTDISSSLVGHAKKTFAGRDMMKFTTLDCDRAPPAELRNRFDVVVATNCIHATKNAASTAANMAQLLREDGVFCLVEFTRGLYWFDLVYGLLEGWWAFSDGRQHALADQSFWDNSLRTAGFRHVSWTDGNGSESRTIRVICAFPAAAEKESYKPLPQSLIKRAGLLVETFTWKRVGELDLKADVYFPKTPDEPGRQRPVALMIHGGGHLLFSRQDIPMKHVRVLLQRGFLPVSVDYRLCPELSLFDGPVTDCRDALKWAREALPNLKLSGPGVRVDPSKLLALGWSSGGQLAMTLGYTARAIGIRPPDVILPFYSPSDLEADFWDKPIYPEAAEEPPTEIWGELDCVRKEPIVEYTPLSNKRATALSLTLRDDRARLILHMNWKAQSVPVLIRGLPHKSRVSADDKTDWKALPKPSVDKIRECSPYWHILQGDYHTPTFMVHGNADDWIPYQMTQKTIAALKERGVPSGILIPDQCGHAFDLFPEEDMS